MNWWASKIDLKRSYFKKHDNPVSWKRLWEMIEGKEGGGRHYFISTFYHEEELVWHWYNNNEREEQVNHFDQPSLTEQLIKAAELEEKSHGL